MRRRETLQHVLPIAIEELNAHDELDSCIMASMVVNDVLSQVGIHDAFPLTVKPKAMNPPLSAAFEQNGMSMDGLEDLNWEEYGYAMASFEGSDRPDEGWPAHLVTIIPYGLNHRPALLDLAIVRLNNRGLGFHVSPIFAGAPEGFVDGHQSTKVTMNGCLVLYRAFPDDKSYEDTELWNNCRKQRTIADAIVQRLE